MERHFPVSHAVPEYILVQSPRDLRTPQALADLEQMAQRVSQLLLFDTDRAGLCGLCVVLAVGLVAMAAVRVPGYDHARSSNSV